MFFVAMPPGWHITSNPGVLLYHPARTGTGQYRLQSQIFLTGAGQEEYGILARPDGRVAVLKRAGTTTTPLVDWKINDAAVAHPGEGTAKNVFKVEVLAAEVVFSVNDKEVARLPKSDVPTDGLFGMRAGARTNLHVSTFDATYVLAPVPIKK